MTEKKAANQPHAQMLISYVPGEECRVAVVEDGKLEEFHAERASNISRVGNIYVGTVTNVEPAIQAAFVDFGVEHHGFLHVTDVHPRYFPGEDDETTERVGKKTPRRDRPPIQKCFRRGDQVEVQVLKEGVGTKGPTLTSYLSIPGRFLVMMPQMDRVGVSRKVEDEEQRRAMRQVLDQLDLPEGFGFIVRTAGMDRTKTELKRDLAYLQRLWKDMETRRKSGSKPRLLYSESDLLVRALRDMVGPEIDEIVIDNELALARAARFLKIVAPRSKVKLLQYQGQTPLFHAYGIEQQLALMHAREVPLPGGGRLVIDETEALVAIDVNSGKMRDARDAETNAYRTNCEAVEEICRQLKLRDLGGIVINDLIDMRHASHRKDIEARFRERMKRDRARSTLLPISEFGILEMTRQRMRGSHESVHFVDCPTCRGRGMVQKPDSIAADALRNLAAVLDHENIARVEMVVSPRVASELLSGRRKTLNKLERSSGKHVDVRVSETVPIDRISFYAYDAGGADIDVEALPKPRPPKDLKVWEVAKGDGDEAWASDLAGEEPEAEPELTPAEQAEVEEMPAHPIEFDEDAPVEAGVAAGSGNGEGEGQGGRKRRRRRRRGRGRGEGGQNDNGQGQHGGQQSQRGHGQRQAEPVTAAAESGTEPGDEEMEPGAPEQSIAGHADGGQQGQPGEPGQGGRRRRRRRRRGRGGQGDFGAPLNGQASAAVGAPAGEEPEMPILDDEAPRGDSWDLPPSAVRPLAVRPGPAPETAMEPAASAPDVVDEGDGEPLAAGTVHQTDAGDDLDEGREEGPDGQEPPTGNAQGEQNGEPGQGGRRRRRRRRRGRGGHGESQTEGQGQAQGGPQVQSQAGQQPRSQPARPPQQQPPHPPQPQVQQGPPRGQRPPQGPPAGGGGPIRVGGGYQRRGPAPQTPAAPEPKPMPVPRPAPVAPAPAPSPAASAPKPKRVLYSSRRKLGPGEIAKRPQE